MEPLASRLRPQHLEDVIGQEHLTGKDGVIKLMLDNDMLRSFILYGPPGTGKTTIAKIIKDKYDLKAYEFNASKDSKIVLKEISDLTKYYDNIVVIIDEIHRMNKATQDYLLPFLEDGRITIIGLTTSNPYISINRAIRSRLNIYKMNTIKEDDVFNLLKNTIKLDEFKEQIISDEVINYLVTASGREIRTALNMLESLKVIKGSVSLSMAKQLVGIKALSLDDKEDSYYDLLSALQKSIRGSDVDAGLYYLARLIKLEDLQIITRRLKVIAYEDISLANPQAASRCVLACDTALELGLPEARIPLANAVIDLSLSPKSNSAEAAIDRALECVENEPNYDIPRNILNREIKGESGLYKYPHDYPNDICYQEYLPQEIRTKEFYIAKETGKYEKALKEQNEKIRKILKK